MVIVTEEMEEDEDEGFPYPISPELMDRLENYPEELSREEIEVILENFGKLPVGDSVNLIVECLLRLVPLLKPRIK